MASARDRRGSAGESASAKWRRVLRRSWTGTLAGVVLYGLTLPPGSFPALGQETASHESGSSDGVVRAADPLPPWFDPAFDGPRLTLVSAAAFQEGDPLAPIDRDAVDSPLNRPHDVPTNVESALLGSVSSIDSLSNRRRARANSPAADAILGIESRSRETTDTGNLVGKSLSARGVSSQQRTPIVTDTRIRGERVGQVLAAGSFWSPVRMDLDTMMNKIDSRLIDSLIIVKGPYTPRLGPGFSFVDIDLLGSPRYAGGYQAEGATSLDYLTNGEQWYGRQTFQGGSDDWGYRITYGNRTGNDYVDGDGVAMPSGYRSQDWNVAVGWDPTRDSRLEFNLLRLDQTDVEFPGLVFDLNHLVTDGYELKYVHDDPGFADEFHGEVWYNRTRFEGDTLSEQKNARIPALRTTLFSPSGVDGFAITDAYGSSFGYRGESVFGDAGEDHVALGTDLIVLKQGLNDIEPFLPDDDDNFPIPPSRSNDFGIYAERVKPMSEWWTLNTGARVDFVSTTSADIVDGVPDPLSTIQGADLDRFFFVWSSYVNSEILLTEGWTGKVGFGFGQRPPTLTELYVESAFIGSLQRGLTFLNGDSQLRAEQVKQIDLGLEADYERTKAGVNWFYAWVDDYITYDLTTPADPEGGLINGAAFVNTDLAILAGIESYLRHDLTDGLAAFGTVSYLEGTDRSREGPARGWPNPRSGVADVPVEALPGIPPLDSRVGLLLHDPTETEQWGIEASVRMVSRQNRIAETLDEVETAGFHTIDLRAFRKFGDSILATAGVENLADRHYREHLDYRSGLGVFRPGINFYFGTEIRY
jgi:iron complex outermembrane recepter protein